MTRGGSTARCGLPSVGRFHSTEARRSRTGDRFLEDRLRGATGDPSVVAGPDGSFYISGISNNFGGMSVSRGTVVDDHIYWSFPVRTVFGSSIDKELLAVDPTTGSV